MKRVILSIVIISITLLTLTSCSTTKATNNFYGLPLVNNSKAIDVSSIELMVFLRQDKTNKHEVVIYHHEDPIVEVNWWCRGGKGIKPETLKEFVTSGYMCLNFAVDLHNNAEQVGIRCAVVVSPEQYHAFNAFNTTDKGLIYVDASAGIDSFAYYQLPSLLIVDSKIREGIGDSAIRYLGNPKTFKIKW